MNLQEIEKCRNIVRAFRPALDRLGAWVVESERYGFLIIADYDGNGCCSAAECEARNADELRECLIKEYSERRAFELIERMPERDAEMIECYDWCAESVDDVLSYAEKTLIEGEIAVMSGRG